MTFTLPKEALGSLPAPDSQGLVRVTAALRLGEDGAVEVVELNDSPIVQNDDENPMPAEDMPDLAAAEESFYQ